MEEGLITRLVFKLIDEKDFTPVKNGDGGLVLSNDLSILERHDSGGYTVVQVVNGQSMSTDEIRQRLDHDLNILNSIQESRGAYLYNIYIFEGYDIEKINIIREFQVQDIEQRKFLSAFTVICDNMAVEKHFDLPADVMGIKKLIMGAISQREKIYSFEDIQSLLGEQKKETLEIKVKTPYLTYMLTFINIAVFMYVYFKARELNDQNGQGKLPAFSRQKVFAAI